jgi:hypothetical protein
MSDECPRNSLNDADWLRACGKLFINGGNTQRTLAEIADKLDSLQSRLDRAIVRCDKHSYHGHACPDCLLDAQRERDDALRRLGAVYDACFDSEDNAHAVEKIMELTEQFRVVENRVPERISDKDLDTKVFVLPE